MSELVKEIREKAEREASRRNSAYDRYGMDNTPESVDPLGMKAADRITELEQKVERYREAAEKLLMMWEYGDQPEYEDFDPLRDAL